MNHETKAAQMLLDSAMMVTSGTSQKACGGEAIAYLLSAAAAIARDVEVCRDTFIGMAETAHNHLHKRTI